jgi:WS/DGAT/MGAT family acyltransferase
VGNADTPLANVDSAWLRMDDPTNLMVVTGVLTLDEPVSADRLRDVIEQRLLRFPRFRQRVGGAGTPLATQRWQDDPAFDLDHHFQVVELPEGGADHDLERFVSDLMARPLDPSRPLWQFHFVPHYQGGSALISRIHHCIGDGLALIYVMLSMADDGAAPAKLAGGGPDEDASPWDAVAGAIRSTVSAGLNLPVQAFREISRLLFNPARITEMTGAVASGVGALGKLLLMDPDPPTPLKGPLVVRKQVAWSRAIAVEDVKRIGKATGATVNDVLVSAVAGGLRRYLVARGATPDASANVRVVVPVNLRPIEEAHLLGNQFGLVFLALPLGTDEPLDRLFEVRSRMTAIKRSPEAFLTFQILRAIGTAPRQIFDLVVNLFERKATAVMTNVIGPREPIRLAGATMRQAMFWVPCAGRLGLGISVLSYAGQVWMGVATDASLIDDPHRILEGFDAEIEALRQLLQPIQERSPV